MLFYRQSSGTNITYDELIDRINETTVFQGAYFASDFVSYITNLLVGIIHDKEIILLDFLNNSPNVYLTSEQEVVSQHVVNTAALLALISKSKAQIGIFSSGTEGNPKLVFHPISKLIAPVQQADTYRGGWAYTVNPAHISGVHLLLQIIFNQATVCDLRGLDREETLSFFKKWNISCISSTPTYYRMLAPYDFALPEVRNVTLNGEQASEELLDQVKAGFSNASIRNVFGSTETGSLMSSSTNVFTIPGRLKDKLRIIDGELHYHNTIVSRTVPDQEWIPSGDLVEIVGEDPIAIKFTSRKSRIINVAGYNVSPQQVEEAILSHPHVQDALVYSKEHRIIGNILRAEVVLLPHAKDQLTEKQLIDYLKSLLTTYKIPRIITFTDRLRLGATGKKSIKVDN